MRRSTVFWAIWKARTRFYSIRAGSSGLFPVIRGCVDCLVSASVWANVLGLSLSRWILERVEPVDAGYIFEVGIC